MDRSQIHIADASSNDASLENFRQNPKGNHLVSRIVAKRTVMVGSSVMAIGAGFYFNWGWLSAAGIAPLILSALPCLAMCALGICASKVMGANKCSMKQSRADDGLSQVQQVSGVDEERLRGANSINKV